MIRLSRTFNTKDVFTLRIKIKKIFKLCGSGKGLITDGYALVFS